VVLKAQDYQKKRDDFISNEFIHAVEKIDAALLKTGSYEFVLSEYAKETVEKIRAEYINAGWKVEQSVKEMGPQWDTYAVPTLKIRIK